MHRTHFVECLVGAKYVEQHLSPNRTRTHCVHTAASTSKGIANAFALVGELAGNQELSESLDHWQRSELNRGQRLMSYGQGLGRSQKR
jgi:hypothetical protein